MFFVLSKLFWLIAQPLSIVLLLIFAGLLFGFGQRRRLAAISLMLSAMIVAVLGYTSLGAILIHPLEERFAPPSSPPSNVSSIVMLGGATDSHISASRNTVALTDGGERLTTTLWLARRYPEANIILSGGGGALDHGGESEAATAQRFFLEQGVNQYRLVMEATSRNTIENAAHTRDLVAGEDGVVVLVTSAFHMPRSVGLFRAQGIKVVPWPTDYRSLSPQPFQFESSHPASNFELASTAIREWIGLVAYRATGQIAEVLPAP